MKPSERYEMNPIKHHITQRGITQKQLAEELNLSEYTISKWVNGKAPEYIQILFRRINELSGFHLFEPG
jgi:transcriptional regulator with XRE-family HTH domain